jgi:hypothetical protein
MMHFFLMIQINNYTCCPPLMCNSAPLIYEAGVEHKKYIVAATSSGVPSRAKGIFFRLFAQFQAIKSTCQSRLVLSR